MKPEIFQLNAESPDALILADQFPLQAHDTVFVGTAGVTQWSRVLNQILPSSFTSVMSRAAIRMGCNDVSRLGFSFHMIGI